MNLNKEKTCCFIGHRKLSNKENLKDRVYETTENLILNNKVDTFLFGSKSEFNDLCLEIVTALKEKHPHIKRIYVRSAFSDISDRYEKYLLKQYEGTYFPEKVKGAGKASYVVRNKEMIDISNFCIFYYDENYLPPRRRKNNSPLSVYQPKSGTKVAYEYAIKNKIKIINVWCYLLLKH